MGCLISRIEAGVGVLSLDRPAQRNAMSPELVVTLHETLSAWDQDPAVSAVVITSSSPEIFCAGGDLKRMIPLISGQRQVEDDNDRKVLSYLKAGDAPLPIKGKFSKPLIAAIEGAAMGGGLELALACDLIVAGDDATFSAPEVKVGAYPTRLTFLLPAVIPHFVATDMLLGLRYLSAAEAESFGLVSCKVARGAAEETAIAMAAKLASLPPKAMLGTLAMGRTIRSDVETRYGADDLATARQVYSR